MKKRKSCTLSQTRSIRDVQSLSRLEHTNSKSSVRSSSHTSPRNKRHAFTRSNSSSSRTIVAPTAHNRLKSSSSSLLTNKKEAFKSLESLFDLGKPFHFDFEDLPYSCPPLEEKASDLDSQEEKEEEEEESKFGKPEEFIEKLKPVFAELVDSSIDLQVDDAEVSISQEVSLTLRVLEETEDSPASSEAEEDSDPKMADESTPQDNTGEQEDAPQDDGQAAKSTKSSTSMQKSTTKSATSVPKTTKSGITEQKSGKSVVSISKSTKTGVTDNKSARSEHDASARSAASAKSEKGSIRAPEYPMPPGFGEGIPIEADQHRESILANIPITDSCVIIEMVKAEERANVIRREIQCLKQIIDELSSKEELSEEDTITLRDTQTAVMQKVGELNEITRKLQRTIGLIDPSSQTFAKMFEMLPYPHRAGRTEERSCENLADVCLKSCEKFAFPQVDYPEDKLPRVIICGNTEENFPKIVVADSRPKSRGNKCLESITGKLSESLCLQEKLVKENAELEGGKHILEQELIEKDNAVECLQRKLCGLQAEMRMVVKENADLSRKIACIAQQQSASPSPCSLSSRSTPQQPRSPCASPKRLQSPPIDLSCRCCSRERSAQPPVESPRSCKPDPCSKPNPSCCKPSPCKPDPCKPEPCKPEPCFKPNPPNPCKPDPCKKPNPCNPCKPDPCDRNPWVEEKPTAVCRPADPCSGRSGRLAGGASRGAEDGFPLSAREQNSQMYSRIAGGGGCQKSPPQSQRCPPPVNVCPAEIEERIAAYGNNTRHLGDQLCCLETEVRTMQAELACVQRERQQLEQQRKLLECTGPCATCACCPEPAPKCPPKSIPDMSSCMPCQESSSSESNTCAAQQLRDLREQYARLQDDYKSKLCEVSRLRSDADCLKRDAREAKEERERMEIKLIDVQERLRAVEAERDDLLGVKEQLVEQEQALLVARQRFREAQDELEELRTMIRDQAAQLDDYRNKYLQAQQQVEEQRRQLDLMEMDNARMNENVTLEIGRVKNQFQEKLAELAPLPDILKQTQIKLQECQQMRMLAEHNCEDLSRELLGAKDKIDAMTTQISDLEREIQVLQDEKNDGCSKIDELEKKNGELRNENERLKNACNRYEEQQVCLQKRLDEKQHEITQLTAMLEQVREDSARQVSRTKERCEAIKRSMQAQISDFEIQLAQCRAAAKTAQKERDEIRQKMQGQIGNLNEALQQAQGRIRSLQGHVDYLKVSYSNVFGGQGQTDSPAIVPQSDSVSPGYDSCDCNY